MTTDAMLTTVAVSWRQKHRNHRLVFGAPARWVRLDWRRRLAVFRPGSVLGYERWRRGRFGTVDWQVFVIETGRACEPLAAIPGVKPGARILLAAQGKDRARRFLEELKRLQTPGAVEAIPALKWQVLGARFAAGLPLEVETVAP